MAVVLARLLGPGEYGRVSVAVAVMTILNTVHSTGLPQAVSRRVAAHPREAAAVLRTALPLQVRATAGSALLVVAGAAALGIGGQPLAPYLAAAALTVVPHGLLNLYLGFDNGRHDFRRQALLLGLYSAAKAGCVIVLAIVFRGIGALAGYAVASLGTLLVGRHRVAAGERFDAASLVRFAGPVVALVGLSATQLNVDLLLVQAFGGSSEDIGWYAAAQQVARAPYLALTGLGMALLPVVARRDAEQDHSGLANTVRQATRFALILLAPAVAVLAVTAPAVIDLLYSERYAPGAAPLPLLMPGMASLALFSILASALTGMARPWLPVAIAAGGLAATVAAAIALIPPYGLVGAALATTIGGAVSLGAALAVLTRLVGPVLPVMTAIRVAGAAVGAAAALAVLRPTGLALVIVVGLVVAGYGALLVVLRELDAADWRRISGVVGRRR